MNDLELRLSELPEALRQVLADQPAVVFALELVGEDRVLLRRLPDVAPQTVAQAQISIAKYREALMNLT